MNWYILIPEVAMQQLIEGIYAISVAGKKLVTACRKV